MKHKSPRPHIYQATDRWGGGGEGEQNNACQRCLSNQSRVNHIWERENILSGVKTLINFLFTLCSYARLSIILGWGEHSSDPGTEKVSSYYFRKISVLRQIYNWNWYVYGKTTPLMVCCQFVCVILSAFVSCTHTHKLWNGWHWLEHNTLFILSWVCLEQFHSFFFFSEDVTCSISSHLEWMWMSYWVYETNRCILYRYGIITVYRTE